MKKLPVVIVGLNFGSHIVRLMQTDPARQYLELAGVCDLDHAKAKAVATPLGVSAYGDLQEVLANPAIRAVGLFTSPAGRAKLIRQCIRAGKDVLTTKPLELDADAALDVLCEAKRLGRVVHANSPSPRLTEDLLVMGQWQKKHSLGRIVGARAEVWASYDEKADGGWYDDPQRCPVAPIYRLGIYLINDLVGLMGSPVDVTVLQSRLRTGRPTADNAQIGILFEGGSIANVFASFCVGDGDHYRNGTVVNFEHGTIYRNVGPQRSGALCEMDLVGRRDGKREILEHAELANRSGEYQWEDFYKAVQGEALDGELSAEQLVAGVRVIQKVTEKLRCQALEKTERECPARLTAETVC